MGSVYAEITLKNAGDVQNVQRGFLKEDEVRSTVVEAFVDTGVGMVLLGAIPLQDMDLIVDPKNEELTGRHGENPVQMIY